MIIRVKSAFLFFYFLIIYIDSFHSSNLQNLRLQKVNNNLSTIHELSIVLSIDFLETVNEVHPSLSDSENVQSKSISNDTLARLTGVIHSLKQEKQQRLQKVTYYDCPFLFLSVFGLVREVCVSMHVWYMCALGCMDMCTH